MTHPSDQPEGWEERHFADLGAKPMSEADTIVALRAQVADLTWAAQRHSKQIVDLSEANNALHAQLAERVASPLEDLEDRVMRVFGHYEGVEPEEDETWESWYRAAFNMAADEVHKVFVSEQRREAARLNGYSDRMAHRVGRNEIMPDAEREAYEEGARAAERAMGFVPYVGKQP